MHPDTVIVVGPEPITGVAPVVDKTPPASIQGSVWTSASQTVQEGSAVMTDAAGPAVIARPGRCATAEHVYAAPSAL